MLTKGTVVLIRTTNGGEIVTRLSENYRPTYDVVCDANLADNTRWFLIPAVRIQSITTI
jgi:hypothetical protein